MGEVKDRAILEYDNIIKNLEQMQKAPKKVIERTVNDFKQRGPSWIAQEVVKTYNIKKAEITPSKQQKNLTSVGSIAGEGETLSSVALIYRGRVLTHTRFGMTPKTPKQSYTLKAEVLKGQKKTLGKVKKLTKKQRKNIGKNFTRQGEQHSTKSPIMLMSTGAKTAEGTKYIPFQRVSKDRKDIKAIKTLSMPQMISNQKVQENIQVAVNDKLGKRFNHYCEQYIVKK